jgi:hypothetical protein
VEIVTGLPASGTATSTEVGDMELAQEIIPLSKIYLYTLIVSRQIPHAKRGDKFCFTRAGLQAWIMAAKLSSQE